MTKIHVFSDWLKPVIDKSDNSIVRNSEFYIKELFKLNEKLPSKHIWSTKSVEDFVMKIKSSKDFQTVNRVYWQDFARIIEAYGVLIIWRGCELARSALNSINRKEVLAPAIIARSLIELATTAIDDCNTVKNTVDRMVKFAKLMSSNSIKGLITCSELEVLVNRMIYGTRMGDPPDWQRQKNFLTYLKRVSKHPDAAQLTPNYDYLCDIAHPNLLGNARFWNEMEAVKTSNGTLLRMEQYAEKDLTFEIRSKVIWVLGWSAYCLRSSHQLAKKAVTEISGIYPTKHGRKMNSHRFSK